MAKASNLTARGGRNSFDTVAASTASSELVAAVPNKKIRVLAVGISCGGTPSTVQFLSGSTACSPVFQNSISLPNDPEGWFQTITAGEALNVTTGSGSNTGIIIKYEHI